MAGQVREDFEARSTLYFASLLVAEKSNLMAYSIVDPSDLSSSNLTPDSVALDEPSTYITQEFSSSDC